MLPFRSTLRLFATLGSAAVIAACGDWNTSVAPENESTTEPALAKAPPSGPNGSVTLVDAGMDYTSDGHGAYTNGVCGVVVSGPTTGGVSLALTGSSSSGCAWYPRRATMAWALQHVSDYPDHVDQPATGSDNMRFNMTFGGGGVVSAAVFNGGTRCYYRARNGVLKGKGLRFDPVNYPKSSALLYEQLGTNTWRVRSQAYPNNLAYCEGDAGISYWHVNLDLTTTAQ